MLIDEARIHKRAKVRSNEFPGFAHAFFEVRDSDLIRGAQGRCDFDAARILQREGGLAGLGVQRRVQDARVSTVAFYVDFVDRLEVLHVVTNVAPTAACSIAEFRLAEAAVTLHCVDDCLLRVEVRHKTGFEYGLFSFAALCLRKGPFVANIFN